MVIVWFLGVLWLTFFFIRTCFENVSLSALFIQKDRFTYDKLPWKRRAVRTVTPQLIDHFCKWPINQLLLSIEINYHHGIPRRVFETGFSLFRVGRGLLHSFQTSRNSVNFNLFRQKPALLCNGNFITLFEQWDRRTPKGCNPAFYSFLFNSI